LSEAERILNQVKNELNVEEQSFEVVAFLLLAEVAWWLASGEPEKALARIQSIVPWAKRVDVRCHLAEALLLQGRAHLALKEWELAREALLEAEGIAAEMKQRRVWWQILAALFELESAVGHTDVAERYREQFLEIIHFIADQIDDPELRKVFLGRTAINVLTKM
jgi:tetratricopeptide (TPR) repeat protein